MADVIAHPDDRVIVRQILSATDPTGRPTLSVRWVARAFRDRRVRRVEVFDSQAEALEAARLRE